MEDSKLVRVAVDAMGGDYAPSEIVKGAVNALLHNAQLDVTLAGDEKQMEELLKNMDYPTQRLHLLPTTQVIEMAEPPVAAIMRKKDSSIVQGMKLVRKGECDAFVTAGSTGATLVGGQTIVGRLKGIERAPLAPLLPTAKGPVLLIDCGANVDARASQLVQFAQMGSIYMENIVGVKNPRVALFNIGAEEEKGNAAGGADVVVCDAFTGNAILKMYEGVASVLLSEIKGAMLSSAVSKLGALLVKPSLKKTLRKFSVSSYGGAPLLGLTGLVVKTHGNAKAIEVENSIAQCIAFTNAKVNEQFRDKMHLVDHTKPVETRQNG